MDRINIDPKVWGNPGWKFLDAVIAGYPVFAMREDRQQMESFLIALGYVLPCEKCRNNFRQFVIQYPPSDYVGGRAELAYWMQNYKRASPVNDMIQQILTNPNVF